MLWWLKLLGDFVEQLVFFAEGSLDSVPIRDSKLKMGLSTRSRSWPATWPLRWIGPLLICLFLFVLLNAFLLFRCTLKCYLFVKWSSLDAYSVPFDACCGWDGTFVCCPLWRLQGSPFVACVFVLLATRFTGFSWFLC